MEFFVKSTGWFFLGLANAFGPCLFHTFVFLPFLSLTRRKCSESLAEVLYFSLARSGTYIALGALASVTGRMIRFFFSPSLFLLFRFLLGGLLLGVALVVLLEGESRFCRRLVPLFTKAPGRTMGPFGVLTALTPCPVFLGLLVEVMGQGRMLYGLTSGALFALGTVLSPLLLFGPLWGAIQNRFPEKYRAILGYVSGLVLFGYGLCLLLSGILP